MMRRWVPVVTLLLGAPREAAAEDEPAPLFPGHRYLSVYTKEVSGEGSVVRLGNGRLGFSGGSSMAAFYRPWLSIQGSAQGVFEARSGRQSYDTRAVLRLIWPEPLLGRLFLFAGVGGSVFFFEEEARSGRFVRGLGPVLAGGLWVQLTDRLRLRAEVRDHWLIFGQTELTHNVFATVSLAQQIR
ncbi:MAG: hypothetical protein MUF64_12800 [Polyangiaceae bacterium]|jgi:hypothetical protein|nr:hypothetical protein [Polyangiaceae bacterium]